MRPRWVWNAGDWIENEQYVRFSEEIEELLKNLMNAEMILIVESSLAISHKALAI